MTDGEALLEAIVRDPDDDLRRRVYADWLEENGQAERAEFVRASVDSEPRTSEASAATRALRLRAEELARRNWQKWFGGFDRFGHGIVVRGFIGEANISAEVFANEAAEIFAEAPLLESVTFEPPYRALVTVAARPELSRLRSVTFLEAINIPDYFTAFCSSPHLGELRSLVLSRKPIGSRGAFALTRACVPALAHLLVDAAGIEDLGARTLLGAKNLAGVRRLNLASNHLTDACIEGVPIGERHCEELILRHNGLTAQAARVLAASGYAPGLRELSLGRNPLGDDGVAALASSPRLAGLRGLELNRVGAGTGSVSALFGSPHLRGLERLTLTSNALAWPSMGDGLPLLQELKLGDCSLREGDLLALSAEELPSLRRLQLDGATMVAQTLRELLTGVGRSLDFLSLLGCHLGDDEAAVLADSALRSVDVRSNPLSERAKALLRDRFGPHCLV